MDIQISAHLDTDEIGQLIERLLRLQRAAPQAQPTIITGRSPAPIEKSRPKPAIPADILPSESATPLAPGNVSYRVEIDGVPVAPWDLDYPAGKIPAKRGSLVAFAGKEYRLTKLYGTNLYLTSMDSERYWIRPDEGHMEQRL